MTDQPNIQLLPATEADYPVVQNLCSYYIYDYTEYMGWSCPESGRFSGCDDLFTDWQAGRSYPYVIRVDGELAGFTAVAVDVTAQEFCIQQFFILRKFRRHGIGKAVAHRLFTRFTGAWQVEMLTENTPATRFWPAVIQAYQGVAPQAEEHDASWGQMQTLRFTAAFPAFTFNEVPILRDGELEVVLERTIPFDPVRCWLPVYDCSMRVNGQQAGNINLRVGNTMSIVLYGGHIGYGVFPAFRGHHYAERACRLLFPVARAHGLATLWITTNPDNLASRRTCERLGARLVEIVSLPEDHDMYGSGEREKCRYRIEIAS